MIMRWRDSLLVRTGYPLSADAGSHRGRGGRKVLSNGGPCCHSPVATPRSVSPAADTRPFGTASIGSGSVLFQPRHVKMSYRICAECRTWERRTAPRVIWGYSRCTLVTCGAGAHMREASGGAPEPTGRRGVVAVRFSTPLLILFASL
jgi:hypothetical protein